jgi:hypothetical protein
MTKSEKFEKIVASHLGRITAHDDFGAYRVEFDNFQRAAGFYDEMFDNGWSEIVETKPSTITIKITG